MPVIDVVGAQAGAQQLLEEISFFIGRMGRADTADGLGSTLAC